MGLTFRHTKGSSLTHDELDNNFREFFYSGSVSGSSIVLYRSRSLDSRFVITPNTPAGTDYNIQYKEGNGDFSNFAGTRDFIYDYRESHLKVTGSITSKGDIEVQGNSILTGNSIVSGTVNIGNDLNVTGSSSIEGNLVVGGTVTAEEFITEKIGTSYIYKSGSTKFGDTPDDIHSFTGSVSVEGTLTSNGLIVANLASINNLVVNGTGSFNYMQSITGSSKVIGSSYLILNNNTPALPYAGIKVIDSGSTGETGSFEYDSNNNHWFYDSTNEGYSSGFIAGARSTRGALVFPTNNRIVKSTGGNHIEDSNITDNGTLVSVQSHLYVSGNLNNSGSIKVHDRLSIPNFPDVSASLASIIATSGIQGLGQDTSPTLGGDLDISGSSIIGTGSIDVIGDISGSTIYSTSNITALGVISGSQIHSTGDITAEGDIIAFSSSDRELKDNIKPISNPIEKIKQIGGYEFDWNDKQDSYIGHDIGVIAQEIEQVLPELVRDRSNGYKAVKYDKIVALLIEAVKDQQKQIDELKSKL